MGPVTEERFGITQFAGTNFSIWKFRVETLLIKHNVAHCLTEKIPTDSTAKATFIEKDTTAIALLVQCVADSHLEYVKDATTAKAIWERLCSTFEPRGTSNKLFLLRKMLTLKFMEGEESIEQFLVRFDELLRKTKVSGCKIEEEMVACLLLLTLPDSYNVVVTAIETLSDDKISVDFVRRRLLDETAKRESCKVELTTSKNLCIDAAAFESSSSTIKCFYCKRSGHKKFQCRKYKADQNRNHRKGKFNNRQQANWADNTRGSDNEDGDHIAFLTSEQTPIQQSWKKRKRTISWFLDSGATDHLINDKSLLSRSRPLSNNIFIGVAKSNQNMCATHTGEIDCSFISSSNICKITIKDVLFVPKLRRNCMTFDMEDYGQCERFLGLNIKRDLNGRTMSINQTSYLNSMLQRFGMENCKPSKTPMEPCLRLEDVIEKKTVHPYRELVGCLSYVTMVSRPDPCYAVNYLSRFQENPTDTHWNHLKRVLRYIKGTVNLNLLFSNSTEPLIGYADADWANGADRKSITGYCFKMYGCLVSWKTQKQPTVSLSSTEAELISIASAVTEAIWLRGLMTELGEDHFQIEIYEDPVMYRNHPQAKTAPKDEAPRCQIFIPT